jgi:acyl-CoA dehydrogenase
MTRWGDLMGGEALEVGYHVDQGADPELVMHDLDGNRVDRVRISPAQRDLLTKLVPMMRPAYEGGSWHHHYGSTSTPHRWTSGSNGFSRAARGGPPG